jgi:hypothetical protein
LYLLRTLRIYSEEVQENEVASSIKPGLGLEESLDPGVAAITDTTRNMGKILVEVIPFIERGEQIWADSQHENLQKQVARVNPYLWEIKSRGLGATYPK